MLSEAFTFLNWTRCFSAHLGLQDSRINKQCNQPYSLSSLILVFTEILEGGNVYKLLKLSFVCFLSWQKHTLDNLSNKITQTAYHLREATSCLVGQHVSSISSTVNIFSKFPPILLTDLLMCLGHFLVNPKWHGLKNKHTTHLSKTAKLYTRIYLSIYR